LHGEVAGRKPKPDDDEETSLTLWELFRQRWALLAGFAVICFFGAVLFLPVLSKAKFKAQNVTAVNNLKQIGLAAQMVAEDNSGNLPATLDTLTNTLGSDKVLTDPETGKPFIYIASGEKLDRLSSNSVLAYSLADKKGHAVLFADGRVEVVNGQRLAELTNRSLPQLLAQDDSARRALAEAPAELKDAGNAVVAPPILVQTKTEADRSVPALSDTITTTSAGMLAANAPAPAAPALAGLVKVPAENNFATPASSVQFAAAAQNFDSRAQSLFKNTIMPAKATAVLANFQVQQSGSALRVVDADGSVYNGSLQAGSAVAQNSSVPTGISTPAGVAPAQDERQKSIATRNEPPAAQNYFFQVSGMNQTLKQKVVFAGNLLALANVTTNLQESFHGSAGGGGGFGGSSQSVLPSQLPWSNSRIAGTAVIADTNNVEVNAVPQSP
jgi:hypothetical protein